jgi:chaperonin GroEL (HSP60 family)
MDIQYVGKTVLVIVRGSKKLVLEETARSFHDVLCVFHCMVKKIIFSKLKKIMSKKTSSF